MQDLIITTPEKLQSLISEAVSMAFAGKASTEPNGTKDFLTEKEACLYLAGCSKATLYKLVRQGKVNRIQLGERRTAYSRAGLQAYLNSGTTTKK